MPTLDQPQCITKIKIIIIYYWTRGSKAAAESQRLLECSITRLRKISKFGCDFEVKFVSNDYNPSTNLK